MCMCCSMCSPYYICYVDIYVDILCGLISYVCVAKWIRNDEGIKKEEGPINRMKCSKKADHLLSVRSKRTPLEPITNQMI